MTSGKPAKIEVETALEELLAWEPLARSPQLARFLRYVVEKTLAGETNGIKAYAIAVDVFGRPQTFDPQSDPIVRVQARRLRSLLEQFYGDGLGTSPARIRLPVGRYVPVFECIAAPEPVPEPVPEAGAEARVAPAVPAAPPAKRVWYKDLVFWSRLFVGFAILVASAVALFINQAY